jgi:nitrate/nitrite-specific signal transduction histidine kinase
VVLLLSSFWATRQFIIRPMSELGKAARQIGAGALEIPVKVNGDAEIELLSNTMEEMRNNLLSSKSELVHWAATLEDRVSQRTQELESLQQVSQEITSRLDIKSVLNSIVEKARHLLSADVAFLCLLDTAGTNLSLQSNSGPIQAISSTVNPLKDSWAEQVIASDAAICNQAATCAGECGVVNLAFRRSQLAVPLSFDQRVIGALCVASKQVDFFTEESANLLSRLANIASLALENATLYAQLERSSMLEERHRIAADMHDGLAQTLSFLGLALEQAELQLATGDTSKAQTSMHQVQRGLDQAAIDIRRAIASLQDVYPAQFTLQEQLESLIQEMDRGGQQLRWKNLTKAPLVLDVKDAEQVLRVVREALINAQKYSQANQIDIQLEQTDGCGVVRIVDNGLGFDIHNVSMEDDRPHFGVKIMQARAARLRGQLDIDSLPGSGTQITLTWPLEKETTHA